MTPITQTSTPGGADPREAGPGTGQCPREGARAVPFLVVFGLVYVGAIAALHYVPMTKGFQILVSLAPVPVFGLYLWRAIAGIRRLDELQQRIQLEALAIAYPLSLLMLMTLGLLQVVEALPARLGEFLKIWPAVAWLYVMGLFIARKRYR
jgi:hypothetical protein